MAASIYKILNQALKWNLDHDGMLRCRTTVLKSCVMPYQIDELEGAEIPLVLMDKPVIYLYVPPEEIADSESIKSLEGKPVSVNGHTWQVAGSIDSVGNAIGTAHYDTQTGLLFSDILVNDPATIKRITTDKCSFEKLIDQSAAYRNEIDWTPGVAPTGERYDGIQRKLRYNHIALLPKGRGRAGEEVRILNKVKGGSSVDYTQLKVGSATIRVCNEDVDKLQNAVEEKDNQVENMIDPTQLSDAMQKLEDAQSQIDTLTSERDTLIGQLEPLRDQLAQLTDPDAQADAMADAMDEQSDADDIMNANGAQDDKADDATKTANKRLVGHALRSHVVNSVRVKNGREPLSEDNLKNQDIVKGMFFALKETMPVAPKTINGAETIKTLNAATDVVSLSQLSGKERLAKQYEKRQGGK